MVDSGLNNNSFIPMLSECERFIKFMDNRFSLGLPSDWVITINKGSPSAIGYFMSNKCENKFINSTQDLNNINLNTIYIKTHSPYECLTHELTHFINFNNDIKDCSSNQYHNKHFKEQAEKLLLSVERTKRGYNRTSESDEFIKMLEEEFKPNKEVFNISQEVSKKKKVGSRLKKWVCGCGCIVRCAVELNAVCLDCNTKFERDDI